MTAVRILFGKGGWARVEDIRLTSMSRAAMYFSSPIFETVSFTSGVKATGEKTATPPLWSLTRVPRPPMWILPNLENGTERVVMFFVISRMTITSDGFEGMSFEVMMAVFDRVYGVVKR